MCDVNIEEVLDAMTDEWWELVILAMMYDVYRMKSPRFLELLAKFEADENWGIKVD